MDDVVVVNKAYKIFNNNTPVMWERVASLPFRGNSRSRQLHIPPATVALDRVSFNVQPAQIYGIVGPSGAGKSTWNWLLATLLQPDEGEILVFGYDAVQQPYQVQQLVNQISGEASFFKRLSPLENLLPDLRSMGDAADARRRVLEILERLGFDAHSIYQPMERLSGELTQKVSVARAVLSQPRLLLLDEPFAGLDAEARQPVFALLRELRDRHGITILMATRDLESAGQLCDGITLIERGQIIHQVSTPVNSWEPADVKWN